MSPQDQLIEEQVVKVLMQNAENFNLSSGTAGALLMEAHLFKQWPSDLRQKNIETAIEKLVSSVAEFEMKVSLWEGIVGILYAFEYTKTVAPHLISQDVIEFVNEMDGYLLNYIEINKNTVHFDLISGITGIGAYALMRTDDIASKAIFSAVEKYLIETAEHSAIGTYWRTSWKHMGASATAEYKETGCIDLGIAHGLPGVISLLAGGVRYNLASDKGRELLDRSVDTLVRLERKEQGSSKYTYFYSDSTSESSRLAWCYGDLGIAFSVSNAAHILYKPELAAYAHQLANWRISQDEKTFRLHDHGFCHGTAGVVHLLRKLAKFENTNKYNRFIKNGIDEIRKSDSGIYHLRPDLLDGVAGILMTFYDGNFQGRQHWDVCFCLGF